MAEREIRYVTLLAADCRRRHVHRQRGKWVTEFSVQIEVLVRGQWRAVVRYDTAHGFAHRDLIRGDGAVEKLPLHVASLNEALTVAENDLRANWLRYRQQFVDEVTRHD